jgi:GntR family histidine utilization transcriptional repressor
MTINKAVTQLARAGYLERRRRAGTFVRQPQVQSAILEIPDIRTEVAALHLPYRFTLIDRCVKPGNHANRERLGIGTSDPVLHLTCLHFAGSMPFCLEQRIINLTAVPDAEHVDFSAVSPGGWLLEQVPWQEAEHTITAISADADLASYLGVPQHAPCLSMERRTWNADHVVTHVRIIYPAASHSLVARFTPS